jgi:hypothetical protein
MRFSAVVDVCYRVSVEFETEDDAPAQVAIMTAMRQIDYPDSVRGQVVEIHQVDG